MLTSGAFGKDVMLEGTATRAVNESSLHLRIFPPSEFRVMSKSLLVVPDGDAEDGGIPVADERFDSRHSPIVCLNLNHFEAVRASDFLPCQDADSLVIVSMRSSSHLSSP